MHRHRKRGDSCAFPARSHVFTQTRLAEPPWASLPKLTTHIWWIFLSILCAAGFFYSRFLCSEGSCLSVASPPLPAPHPPTHFLSHPGLVFLNLQLPDELSYSILISLALFLFLSSCLTLTHFDSLTPPTPPPTPFNPEQKTKQKHERVFLNNFFPIS